MQTVWSVKGGSGVTVVATTLAVRSSRQHGPTVLVDLCGDAPAVLGLAEPRGPGVRDWLAAPASTPEALSRLVQAVTDDLSLLPSGAVVVEPWSPSRSAELVEALAALPARVVVDAGRWGGPAGSTAHDELVAELSRAGASLLVTRPCYLSLRRAVRGALRPDGVILVSEAGRSLGRRDVQEVLGAPVVAEVEVDAAVARSVDAGLLMRRTHRRLDRCLGELV